MSTISLAEPNNNYTLVFDTTINHNSPIPKHYRTGLNLAPHPVWVSGSAQPNAKSLKYIINQAKKTVKHSSKIFIVDLRQEPHAFLNNQAISWFSIKNQLPYAMEPQLIKALQAKNKVKIYLTIDKLEEGNFKTKDRVTVNIKSIKTEQQIVEQLQANYKRLLITDHFAPTNAELDLFLEFVNNLPLDAWVHFHCRGGRGRTSTFMVLYDIIKNGPELTLAQIIDRQYQLGGTKLSKIKSKILRKQWKEPAAQARYELIEKFYQYRLDPNGFGKQSWAKWINK